jgi:hypothetical protein
VTESTHAELQSYLRKLEDGPIHRFADFKAAKSTLPQSGALVYAIWDDDGTLVYVGVSGRNPDGAKGPWSRLQAHWNGARSGNQFTIYVADHYVLPTLSKTQISEIAADEPTVFVDDLVADFIHDHFSFRVVAVPDYRTATAVETAVKAGALSSGRPLLNPKRPQRRRR